MKVKKIVWFTYYSTKEVQTEIQPRKSINSFAPWIPAAIKVFKNDPNYEIHVISPHYYINGIKKFSEGNIFYHFYNQGVPYFGYAWPSFMPIDRWSNYLNLKIKAIRILRKINPDIIQFWGIENTFASTYFGLNEYELDKTVINIQGFVSEDKYDKWSFKRFKNQNKILLKHNSFYTTCSKINERVKGINPNAKVASLIYPINLPQFDNSIEKKFDLVFYGRVVKEKGIEDTLKSLKLLHSWGLDLKLLVLGPIEVNYQENLLELARKLGVNHLITWKGFIATQDELYNLAQQAKIYVLPTHEEILASTIRESMAMKLAVVSYNVGCLSILNQEDERILLAEPFNINDLAEKIKKLISDDQFRDNFINKANDYILKLNSPNQFKLQIENGYKQFFK
jgi:glycosyltransferase involved in cell wall biosynthesis